MSHDILRSVIFSIVNPTPDQERAFNSAIEKIAFCKGDLLLSPLTKRPRLFFITSGIARHWLTDYKGNNITTWFSEAGDLATDFEAFTTGSMPQFTIQAVTELEAYSIEHQQLQKLYDSDSIWDRMGRLVNQQYLIQLIQRNNTMHKKDVRQRYEEFVKTQGHLFLQVPAKHIASYLGMSLETLSRLRSDSY